MQYDDFGMNFQRQLIKSQHVIRPGYADYQQHLLIIWLDYYENAEEIL